MEQPQGNVQCVVQGLLSASLLFRSTIGKDGLTVLNEDVTELVVEESTLISMDKIVHRVRTY